VQGGYGKDVRRSRVQEGRAVDLSRKDHQIDTWHHVSGIHKLKLQVIAMSIAIS
jgi:hypothetical protein